MGRTDPPAPPWREPAGASLRLEAVWLGRQGTGPGRCAGPRGRPAWPTGWVCAVLTDSVRYADVAQHRLADVLDAERLLPSETMARNSVIGPAASMARCPLWLWTSSIPPCARAFGDSSAS